jgi:hypothetical protein
MSYDQLNYVMAPILRVGLSVSGICNSIKREVVYATIRYQGLGIKHPFITQGIRKAMFFIQRPKSIPMVSQLLNVTWNLTKLESGLGDNFITKPYKPYKAITTQGWMTTLWEFLNNYNISLSKQKPLPTMRRTTDRYINEDLHRLPFTKFELRCFNQCRIYLHAELLSDIITMSGNSIRRSVWKGEKLLMHQDRSEWPYQPRPTESAWKLWRRGLQILFGVNSTGQGVMNPGIPLKEPPN